MYLQFHHKGGRCPIFSFTWRDKRVVSVCSSEAYKDMQKLTNRPGNQVSVNDVDTNSMVLNVEMSAIIH